MPSNRFGARSSKPSGTWPSPRARKTFRRSKASLESLGHASNRLLRSRWRLRPGSDPPWMRRPKLKPRFKCSIASLNLRQTVEGYAMAKEAFGLANAKLFLRFQPVRKKRRTVIRIAGGVVTLGAAPPPVTLYDGPTSRKKVKKGNPRAANAVSKGSGRRSPTESEPQDSGREGSSLGNVNRGERI